MTFEEGKFYTLKELADIARYQHERIDELEQWVAAIADEHPQIPDWIQQSARSLLAQQSE
jgi:hypothetical protein